MMSEPESFEGNTLELIAEKLAAAGRFFRAGGVVYFVENRAREPIRVPSKGFEVAVVRVCGLRAPAQAIKRAVASMVEVAFKQAARARVEFILGRGDDGSLLCHVGSGEVRQYVAGRFARVANGTAGVVFQTEQGFTPISAEDLRAAGSINPQRFPALHRTILDALPPPGGALTAEEQRALVLGAWLGAFVAPLATARPIALLIGPHACGKTTTQRCLVKAFYGPEGEVGGGVALDRAIKDLAAGAANQSFVIRDDTNQFPEGALDALCRISTGTTFQISAYFETLAMATYPSRAQLLLSAVVPTWLDRSDLMSRLWIVELAKGPASAISERDRVERVLAARAAIWAETLSALTVLATGAPPRVPISRFDDFERLLFPIMERAGYGPAFERTLRKMPAVAVVMAAKASPFLGALLALAHRLDGKAVPAAELADKLAEIQGVQARSRDPHRASGVTYNPLALAKLLAKVEREGSAVVEVTSRCGHNNTRVWTLTPKVPGPGGDGGVVSGSTSDLEKKKDISADDGPASGPAIKPPNTPIPPGGTNLH
jgi:hypothetical protein